MMWGKVRPDEMCVRTPIFPPPRRRPRMRICKLRLQPILRTQTILRGHLDGDGHVVKGARDEDVEEVAVGRRRDPVRLTSRT
jgi:hypothetical protein